jgi:tetratricopeptide (TPR) repeat protein
LGVAYGRLGPYTEAIQAFKQVIRIKPDYADAHYGLGVAYLIIGDRGSALNEYKILKNLDNNLSNRLFNLIYK